MELIILAAGMGSRFGGLKQLEPMDEHGNFIIDYSIFDAIKAGFEKITFIIRKENENIFKETIGSRIESKIPVEYVFQENDTIPNNSIPSDRTKPLGTAHAILCCKNTVKHPFMIINADDFYGYESYELAADFIKSTCNETTYGCVAYEAGNTITENGSVKRGICNVDGTNITGITESSISKNSHGTLDAKPLNGDSGFEITADAPVSMNMFILDPSVFPVLDEGFKTFTENWTNPEKDEYLLPDVISSMVKNRKAELKIVKSSEKWYGVTYRDDKKSVVKALAQMTADGKYPDPLWD